MVLALMLLALLVLASLLYASQGTNQNKLINHQKIHEKTSGASFFMDCLFELVDVF